ncbi:MAG: SDR family NAD(P)-dependent oxidoreductase [Thermacetogeniaceae bacterium]
MKMSGNTVLITGGSTGIGYALAEYYLDAGNEVIICGRREKRLLEAQANHPGLHIKVCNVADEAERRALLEWTTTNFSSLNILVNNAGVQRDIDFTKGIDEFLAGENEIRINLEAPIVLSGLFIPHLTGKMEPAIINVSSGLGFVPSGRMPVYSATKAGIHAFSMALRKQLVPLGIKVYEVVPPAVDTELNPEGRAKRSNFRVDLKPGEFVAAVMKGIANDTFEIGYGMTEGFINASRAELDQSFERMNSGW